MIVQICPKLNIGGVERGVVDLAIYLKDRGVDNIVISDGGVLQPELEKKAVFHCKLPLYSKNPYIFLINLYRLKKVLHIHPIQLILVYSRIPCWLLFCLKPILKVPVVTHCLGIHRMGWFGLKKLYNASVVSGDWVVANSEFTKQYFVNIYPTVAKKITVVPRSVDLLRYNQLAMKSLQLAEIRSAWKIPNNKRVLLMPARFTYWKGHEILLQALDILKRRGCLIYYTILLGDYAENKSCYKKLQNKIKIFGLQDKVYFAGKIINQPEAYFISDIVVVPSTQPEAFGRTVIEAQAMGRIVVASAHGGVIENIEDGVTGFLFTPGDANALADTLERVSSLNAQELAKIGDLATKSVEKFEKKTVGNQVKLLCKEVITKFSH